MPEDESAHSAEIEEKEDSEQEGSEDEIGLETQTEKQRSRKKLESVLKPRSSYPAISLPPVKLVTLRSFDAEIAYVKQRETKVPKSGNILNIPVTLKPLVSFDRQFPEFLPNDSDEKSQLESSFNLLKPITLLTNSPLDKATPVVKHLEPKKISGSLDASKPLFPKYVSHVIMNLDRNYSTQVLGAKQIEEQTTVRQSLVHSSEAEAIPFGEGSSGSIETPPEEEDIVEQYLSGLGDARAADSLIMILAKEGECPYVISLARICKELYRIYGTAILHHRFVSNAKEVKDLGQDKIIVIHEKKKEGTDILFSLKADENTREREKKLNLDGFIDYLAARKLENYGYVIIYASADTIKQLQSLLKTTDVAPRIAEVTLIEASDYRRFASLAWGESYRAEDTMESFDAIFSKGEKQFDSKLRQILKKLSLSKDFTKKIRTGPSDESSLHYEIKAFVIQCLSKRFKPQDIKVEVKAVGENGLEVPDVQAAEEIYEIETMYGEGHPDPMSKIKKRIEQRQKAEFSNFKLGIVIPPLQALLYYRYLMTIKQAYQSGFRSLDFLIPNLQTMELTSIEKMKDVLKEKNTSENSLTPL